jgi:hypothetical protein
MGLPLGRFPPGSLRTLLDKSSSSWCMTCPAHLSLLSLQHYPLVTTVTNSLSFVVFHTIFSSFRLLPPCAWLSHGDRPYVCNMHKTTNVLRRFVGRHTV